LATLASPENRRFLAFVASAPGTRQGEVAAALGLAKSTVSRRSAILERAGLLARRADGLHVTAPAPVLATP
jgi:DNA-binding MarR family transcriptional regulator